MAALALGFHVISLANQRDQLTALLGPQFHYQLGEGFDTTTFLGAGSAE